MAALVLALWQIKMDMDDLSACEKHYGGKDSECAVARLCQRSLVLKARRYVDEVVTDDGPSDAAAELALLAGAIVARHPRNRGKGAAVRTAISYAEANGADILVLHAGDAQHNPCELPDVVRLILEGRANVAIGVQGGS